MTTEAKTYQPTYPDSQIIVLGLLNRIPPSEPEVCAMSWRKSGKSEQAASSTDYKPEWPTVGYGEQTYSVRSSGGTSAGYSVSGPLVEENGILYGADGKAYIRTSTEGYFVEPL